MSAAELMAEFQGEQLPDDLLAHAEYYYEQGRVDEATDRLQENLKELSDDE